VRWEPDGIFAYHNRMLCYGMEYVDKGAAFYELKHRELQVHQLKWKAAGPKSPDANNV
jgi:hypothetical protein